MLSRISIKTGNDLLEKTLYKTAMDFMQIHYLCRPFIFYSFLILFNTVILNMKLSEFKFDLPAGSIALYPAENRDESRLMVIHQGKW
jgi:hypothetical protein